MFHGNISSKSLYISGDEKTPTKFSLTLIDFGNAFTQGEKRQTRKIDFIASPPELLKYGASNGDSTTVFQLGVLFYQLISGKMPWQTKDEALERKYNLQYPFGTFPGIKYYIEQAVSMAPQRRQKLKYIKNVSFSKEIIQAKQEFASVVERREFQWLTKADRISGKFLTQSPLISLECSSDSDNSTDENSPTANTHTKLPSTFDSKMASIKKKSICKSMVHRFKISRH